MSVAESPIITAWVWADPALPMAAKSGFGSGLATPVVSGPMMAAADRVTIEITGRGGHGATPHETIDPIIATVGMVQALQSIVSRNTAAIDALVVSVTQIHSGTASNIIPETATFCATIRSFTPEVRDLAQKRFTEIVQGHAAAYGVSVDLNYERGYPPTVNHPQETEFAAEVAREISGAALVDANSSREMGAEDFAYFLEKRPGAYLFLGNGDTAGLHHPAYDFTDETAAYGASFFARVVERALPVAG